MNCERHCGCLNQESIPAPIPLPSISVFFLVRNMAGRRGQRWQTATHPGCILTSKQGVTAVHIWASKLENSSRPCSPDAALCLKGCCGHEMTLWLARKPRQRCETALFSTVIALCPNQGHGQTATEETSLAQICNDPQTFLDKVTVLQENLRYR